MAAPNQQYHHHHHHQQQQQQQQQDSYPTPPPPYGAYSMPLSREPYPGEPNVPPPPPPPGFAPPTSAYPPYSGYSAYPGDHPSMNYAQYPPPSAPPPGGATTGPGPGSGSGSGMRVGAGDNNAIYVGDGKPEGNMFAASFSEKKIRMAFIRKVYTILLCQIVVTLAFIALCMFEKRTKQFLHENYYLYYVSYGVFAVTYFTLVCCSSVRRKYPTNVIMLCIFTLATSFMVGMISSYHKTEIVFYSMAICAVVCLAITIFALQTKFDFTLCGSFLCIAALVLFMFGLFAIIFQNRILNMVYSALIALLFSLFLAYDTQMIAGGRRHELSPEEYIYGALQLYMDVVYIFLVILNLFGNSK